MKMASFVYVGEYSTACACRPKMRTSEGSEPVAEAELADDEAAIVAASVGVELQRRRIQEAATYGGIAGGVAGSQ